MTDPRPVLIGMNNPLGSDPRHALFPAPQGCTGHRIWEMLHERLPNLVRADYIRVFDRRNALSSRVWNLAEARAEVERTALWTSLESREVLVLGKATLAALRLPQAHPLSWQSGDTLLARGPARWCLVPHPSGLNRWYNDEVNRIAVGMRLEELYLRAAQQLG